MTGAVVPATQATVPATDGARPQHAALGIAAAKAYHRCDSTGRDIRCRLRTDGPQCSCPIASTCGKMPAGEAKAFRSAPNSIRRPARLNSWVVPACEKSVARMPQSLKFTQSPRLNTCSPQLSSTSGRESFAASADAPADAASLATCRSPGSDLRRIRQQVRRSPGLARASRLGVPQKSALPLPVDDHRAETDRRDSDAGDLLGRLLPAAASASRQASPINCHVVIQIDAKRHASRMRFWRERPGLGKR